MRSVFLLLFLFFLQFVHAQDRKPLLEPFSETALLRDSLVRLDSIFFELNKGTLRPESFRPLDSLAAVLKRHPGMEISIEGHLDGRASDKYSTQLSVKRAKTCVDYLVRKSGIEVNRLRYRGFEGKVPARLADGAVLTTAYIMTFKTKEEQEALHRLNRRMELRLLCRDCYRPFVLPGLLLKPFNDSILLTENQARLDSVKFDGRKDSLLPQSLPQLDRVAAFLKTNPAVSIEISAHCSYPVNPAGSSLVSMQQAIACVDYIFRAHGISHKRMMAKGGNDLFPARLADEQTVTEAYIKSFPNSSDQQKVRSLNDRVEIRVICRNCRDGK